MPGTVAGAMAECAEAIALGTRGAARWKPVVERVRSRIAEEFGTAEAEVSFMSSTGEAMNAIARAVRWQPGDEVLVLSDDFPTVVLPWIRLGDDVRVVQVKAWPGDDRLGALLASIGPRTRLVAVSHVNSLTGGRIDLEALGTACARAGALLVCDGAQAAGCIPVILNAVDFYIATSYKWLLAGFGLSVVIGKQASLAQLTPGLLGHGNPPPSHRLTYGHLNLAGVYALDAATALRRQIGVQAIHDQVAQLARRIHEHTSELGLRPAADLANSAGIVALTGLPDVPAAVAKLSASGISVANRGNHLRISPYFYTTDRDIDRLLRALKHLRDANLDGEHPPTSRQKNAMELPAGEAPRTR
jgi:selenocysteine lyase/cysteine desulfurase